MKVVEVVTPDQKTRYYLEDAEEKPVEPVLEYIRFRDNAGYARNTLRMQCIHLKHYFTFLGERGVDYEKATVDTMARFVAWLRNSDTGKRVVAMRPKEDGGSSNLHFHVMCPIRPLDEHGKWGNKQRQEYLLDENGERICDEAGNYVFNAVPTTDWGSPETLEHWREQWAALCNQKFAEKELSVHIDHRSYERQGVEQIPTIHEGVTVRAMESKGIRTDKGDLNLWIKTTNAMLRETKQKIAKLIDWLKEVKVELSNPQTPLLTDILGNYYTKRNRGAYSDKAKTANLQKYADAVSFLQSKNLVTVDDLETLLDRMQGDIETSPPESLQKRWRISNDKFTDSWYNRSNQSCTDSCSV